MMKKLIILAGLLVSLQVNAQNYAKQWCADNGAQFKQKQRKVKMREMSCKWLRMSNIS